jgi:hypothetical protein
VQLRQLPHQALRFRVVTPALGTTVPCCAEIIPALAGEAAFLVWNLRWRTRERTPKGGTRQTFPRGRVEGERELFFLGG